jgi:citronellol/citronellal dehydrogenase
MSYQSVFRADLFKDQTVIVTGGGSGIGRCAAHELSSLGAHVALVGRRADKLAAVEAEIREDGGAASVHPCDIRDEEAVGAAIEAVLKAQGALMAWSTTPAANIAPRWRRYQPRALRRLFATI